jgi:hypothetical protein
VIPMNRAGLRETIEKMRDSGFLGYGKVIPRSFLEEVFDVPYSETWDWRGPVLQLREHLMDMGWFVSERGTDDGDIRFLTEQEIPEVLERRRKKRYSHMSRDMNIATALPLSSLGRREQITLMHERDRLGRDIAHVAKDNPEMKKEWVES